MKKLFSYYGSKSKIVHLYPQPKHKRIIEPFAGSARYSLRWFGHDITIVDANETVIKIWRFLQQATPADIMGLPNMKKGERIESFGLSEAEGLLMGFLIGRGSYATRQTPGDFCNVPREKRLISRQLFKIKHWQIVHGDYRDIENQDATWFIDAPYQVGGRHYRRVESIDFDGLARWSQTRRGQVIVCENTKARWLPFRPISNLHGSRTDTTEAVWMNDLHQPSFAEMTP